MNPGRIVIIADDITGAADAIVPFAREGFRSMVLAGPAEGKRLSRLWDELDAVAITTESRGISSGQARAKVRQAIEFLEERESLFFYKKVDSTLRGNLGAEIDEMMHVLELAFAVVCPAFPAQGRTVVKGRLMVRGRPLKETEAAFDPVTPVNESHIPVLIRRQSRRTVCEMVSEKGAASVLESMTKSIDEGCEILVADAQTDDELAEIARASFLLKRKALLAGSGGLAGMLARNFPRKPEGKPPRRRSGLGLPVLCVVGSQSEAMADQILRAGLKLGAVIREVGDRATEESLVDSARKELASGKDVVLKESKTLRHGVGMDPCESLADVAHEVMRAAQPWLSGVFVSGGDTASALCRRFGIEGIEIVEEVAPGIPAGRIVGGEFEGIDLVTKAGAFGDGEVLVRIIDYLRK